MTTTSDANQQAPGALPPKLSEPIPDSWWLRVLTWYWQNFIKSFCFRLPLPLLLLFLVAITFNFIGEGFGIVGLVWQEDDRKRFVVGASMAMLALQVFYIGYVLWLRDRREHSALQPGAGTAGPELSFLNFTGRICACLALTVLALYLIWWTVGALGDIAGRSGPTNPLNVVSAHLAGEAEATSPFWEAADPGPLEPLDVRLWRFLLLPLGIIAVVLVVWVLYLLNVGAWLADRRPLEHLGGTWRRLSRRIRELAKPGRHLGMWIAAAALGGVWLIAVLACIPSLWDTLALLRLAVPVIGLGLFGYAFRRDRHDFAVDESLATAKSIRHRLWLNVASHAALAYLVVTYVLSRWDWFWGLMTLLIFPLALAVALAFALPHSVTAWLKWRYERSTEAPDQDNKTESSSGLLERSVQLWPIVLLAGLVFFLACNWPEVASPVPIVSLFFFGLIVAYGIGVCTVRRAVPVAFIALIFFATLGGLLPYKYRFDSRGLTDDRTDGLNYYHQPLDLNASLKSDRANQAQFDTVLAQYDTSLKNRDDRQARLKNDRIQIENGVPVDPAQLRADENALQEAETDVARLKHAVQTQWQKMERENRVVAGRVIRPDLNLAFLNQDEYGQPLLDNSSRLLDVDDLIFRPAIKNGERKPPLIVIAVSGGGLRSAAWTFAVLAELEQRFAEAKPRVDFPAHVRVITGASGGMLGAAYYVATLPHPRAVDDSTYRERRRQDLDRQLNALTKDCLTPLIKQYVYGDLPNLFSPWSARNDRGKELERTWSENLGGALDRSFAELRSTEKEGNLPSLVFTPMMIEDGRRLIISNLDMRYPISNDGNLITAKSSPHAAECYSREALELFRLFPEASATLRLSTAVRMSAAFPFFGPAVPLPLAPRRRLVDAGYYDNYGVSLSAAWLFSTNNRPWLLKNCSSILLIQIRDGLDDAQRTLADLPPDGSTGLGRSVEEFSSPFEGLFSARVASSSFRNDGQLELLSQFMRERTEDLNRPGGSGAGGSQRPAQAYRYFQVVNLEFPERVALSWHLSEMEKKRVRHALVDPTKDVRSGITQILVWWRTAGINVGAPIP
jgi:predicted acylesterase/phospholipase RssA